MSKPTPVPPEAGWRKIKLSVSTAGLPIEILYSLSCGHEIVYLASDKETYVMSHEQIAWCPRCVEEWAEVSRKSLALQSANAASPQPTNNPEESANT